jgi:hypothetical protein
MVQDCGFPLDGACLLSGLIWSIMVLVIRPATASSGPWTPNQQCNCNLVQGGHAPGLFVKRELERCL